MNLPWNEAGELVGTLIGLFWVALGSWWVAIGRRRQDAAAGWDVVTGRIVDREGGAEGLLIRNPHLAYAARDGSQHRVRSRSRGDIWQPGQSVDVLVDPDRPERAMLVTHAERGTPFLVIGWFLVMSGVLTLIASVMLAVWG